MPHTASPSSTEEGQLSRSAGSKTSAAYALLTVALALLWQFLTVTYNFGGNWTALFQTGAHWTLPPGDAFEGTYRFENTLGFDGQFYRYIAHDPFFAKGFDDYVDLPRMRWSRVLLPGLVYLAAFGQAAFIDPAYVLVVLAFLFVGSYWLSRFCQWHGRHPAWGLTFALIPAVTISIERLTVDIALLALCVGFALYATQGMSWKLYLIIALAPLARETGALLLAAGLLYSMANKQWTAVAWHAVAGLPWGLWLLFVRFSSEPSSVDWGAYLASYPLGGILHQTLHPPRPWLESNWKQAIAGPLDYLALLGMWLALILSVRLLAKSKWRPVESAIGLFVLLALLLANFPTWGEAYAFGRYFSPLLAWLAMRGLATRRVLLLWPLVMVVPRVLAQLTPQTLGIVAGIFGIPFEGLL